MAMLPFRLVLLWTDVLVFVLLAIVIALVVQVARHEHLQAPWRKVVRSAGGLSALVVLLVYGAVALVDSVHFQKVLPSETRAAPVRYAPDVLSLLDALAEPLRVRTERTFSAPLATHLFGKETITRPDGTQVREFPRLRHGGAHLEAPARDWSADVAKRVLQGLAAGALVWMAIGVVAIGGAAAGAKQSFAVVSGAVWRGDWPVPLRAMLITVALLVALVGPAWSLAGAYHVLGTDKVGQDVLYLVLKSIRTGVVIGTVTTLVMLPFALAAGIVAGWYRGWVDDAVQYLYTTLASVPSVLLIAAAVLMLQVFMDTRPELFDSVTRRADFRLLALCLILGVTSWTGLCRLLRAETLKLRELEFVQAARALGVRPWQIMLRHLLPNVMHIVVITTVLGFSGLVLAEAVLSYVGVGVDPAMISFGTMINAARLEMAREPVVWWSLASAFAFMFVLVLAANVFADAVRDALDPRTSLHTSRAAALRALAAGLARPADARVRD